MPFPEIRYCLLCDAAVASGAGKVTLIGFSGVAPAVLLYSLDLTLPIQITFLFVAGSGRGQESTTFDLIDPKAPHVSLVKIGPVPAVLSPTGNTLVAFQVAAKFPRPGRYQARLTTSGQQPFLADFIIQQGQPPTV